MGWIWLSRGVKWIFGRGRVRAKDLMWLSFQCRQSVSFHIHRLILMLESDIIKYRSLESLETRNHADTTFTLGFRWPESCKHCTPEIATPSREAMALKATNVQQRRITQSVDWS